MAENDEFLIRGEDDLGNELVFELNSYRNPDLVFDLTDSGISPNAKTVTLELYVNKEEKNRTKYKKYETGIEDAYGEGRVYESDEDPLDLYSPVEGKIEIKIR